MENNIFDSKYVLKVFIVAFLIFSLIVFINSVGLHLNEPNQNKKLLQVVTMEGFDSSILMDKSDAFCEAHRGSSGGLDESCGKLTQNKCNSTSCCVWTSENKCVAGNENGPTFNTGAHGKTHTPDFYYFQNKCYGEKC
jgi:hypothetical protein